MALIDICKKSMRITKTNYDDEIQFYIDSAKKDLEVAGVIVSTQSDDALINKAVLTYVRASFGSPADKEDLMQSYKEQKATLMNATGYTDWGAD